MDIGPHVNIYIPMPRYSYSGVFMEIDEEVVCALSNKNRLKMYSIIFEEGIINKTDLGQRLSLDRAALDYHLKYLLEAGLIGIHEQEINKNRHVLIYPQRDLKMEVSEMSSFKDMLLTLPPKLEERRIDETFESLKKMTKTIGSGDIARIMKKLSKYVYTKPSKCDVCRGIIKDINVCENCFALACGDCMETIHKTEGNIVKMCRKCIDELFT